MAHPIWLDYFVTFSGESCDFSIEYDGDIIYEGTAVRRPGTSTIQIKINDICADYLRQVPLADVVWNGQTDETYGHTFIVNCTDGETSTTEEVTFSPNYTYDYLNENGWGFTPIGSKVGKYVCVSSISAVLYVRAYDADNALLYDRVVDVSNDTMTSLVEGTDDARIVEVEFPEYTAPYIFEVDECARHQLVFRNAVGGIGWLLIEGKSLMTDTYSRTEVGTAQSNDLWVNRQTRIESTDITRKWVLHTGWIDDASAKNMHHLLSSPEVLLYDKDIDDYYAVNILNSSCEYKTYSNNGNQLVRYDIEVEFAQTITRR